MQVATYRASLVRPDSGLGTLPCVMPGKPFGRGEFALHTFSDVKMMRLFILTLRWASASG